MEALRATVRKMLGSVWGLVAIACAALIVLSGGVVLAQDGTGVVVVEAPLLTSIGAVVVATITVVGAIKKTLSDYKFFGAVPIWVYVVCVAAILTALANKVFHTLPGDNVWILIWNSIYNAAAASGVREWIYSGPTKPMAESL